MLYRFCLGVIIFELNLSGAVFAEPSDLMLIAHRGVVTDTLTETLEESIRRGYTHIEVDLRMTKDGEIVCLHDNSLKRTTGVAKHINRITLQELYELTTPEIVPTLEMFCKDTKGKIELMPDIKKIPRGKEKEFAGKLEATLSHYGLLYGSLFIGDKSIHPFIKSQTQVSTSASVETVTERIKEDPDYARTHFVFGHADDFMAANVKGYQALGLKVVVNINLFHYPAEITQAKGREDVKAMRAFGVDGLQIDSDYDGGLVK
jgi:glycerophosphoryl diester phosphodiesterase